MCNLGEYVFTELNQSVFAVYIFKFTFNPIEY